MVLTEDAEIKKKEAVSISAFQTSLFWEYIADIEMHIYCFTCPMHIAGMLKLATIEQIVLFHTANSK